MKILVLGATGRTGSLLAWLAISKDHQITTVVRDRKKANIPGVNYIDGLPTDEKLLTEILKGIDAVVVSLNISRTSDSPYAKVISPLTLISDSVQAVLAAMEKNSVKRIITVSASGVGNSWKDMPWVARVFIRNSNIWKAYLDHDRQEKLLRQSPHMEWTIVRPVMLDDKEDEAYFATTGKPHRTNISRKAVARFLLYALESGKYIKDCVTISR